MSLAELYNSNNHSLGDDSEDDESDDEFVPGLADDDNNDASDNDSDDGEHNDRAATNDDSEEGTAVPPEEIEQQKRKIDDIWQEMNSPTTHQQKITHVDSQEIKEEPNDSTAGVAEVSSADKAETTAQNVVVVASDGLRRAPKRKASQFSRMAEMVEQRRAKKENTLDKARREWTGFVENEGIREDLDKANKDGYVERQEFLRRVDERRYEKSREQK
ncbi:bucentaur or craniofacial development-domain-containing protein [Kickxella alabastrina]|uniref:bucentaur or craniofacial development-domain-containing protein n=1 Tax=Kickxella alabastrina TaxID=61397 RepID=UPI00221FC962|nr:bucentaur or craniofacial development-domain-containing protein [Kickxella alabastrina]KAI7824904.1 bucentaur or craniofacial development-domain-containing protein [Kickxella alabastrina]